MYYLELREIEKKLKTNLKKGLDEKEAGRRLKEFGKNKVELKNKRTIIDIILEQFKNSILWLLILASVISFFIGEIIEAAAILVAVVISVGFGSYLEYKADKSLEKLKKMNERKAMVEREGKIKIIAVEDLVPGDIIVMQSGSYIGADAIVIESSKLYVDESHLTGESLAVAKKRGKIKKDAPIAERFNMVFAGSFVLRGEGKAVVIATGKKTELGAIAENLSDITSEETPLMKNLNSIGKKISVFSVILILIVFLIGYLQRRNVFNLFIYAITLAVAAVPEGLTAVLTIMLTLSVLYMAKKNALVKKVSSVETIGNVDLIAVDKTGTITEGKLGLAFIASKGKIKSLGEYKIDKTLELAVLANSAKKEKNFVGDDIDVAIMRSVEELGESIEKIKKKYKIRRVISFSQKTRSMSAELGGRISWAIKGAYENIIEKCDYIDEEKIKKMDANKKREVRAIADRLAEEGYRVIGVAYVKDKKTILSGFLAFLDKEKPGVKKAVKELKNAGIKIIMLTGDSIKTANAIAKRVGIEGEAIEWDEIKDMNDDDIYKKLTNIGVIARSTPKSKLRIVNIGIKNKHIIGVTGDGINDALALKRANVGIVMGKRGSEISKEVADLILLDDNFYTMVNAVKYGRNLINNIINFIRFQFTANFSALIITISALILEVGFPLTPLQLLWINIIMDGPPALSLGFEKPKKDVMKEKPRKGKNLFSSKLLMNIGITSIYIAIVTFTLFYLNLKDIEKALSFSFNTFVFMQLFNTLNCRSLKSGFYEGIWQNKILVIVLIFMAIVQILINYIPVVNEALEIKALSLNEWIVILLSSVSVLGVGEIEKNIKYLTEV